MGQDIHGFIEIFNFHGLNEWTQYIDISFFSRSYSSYGFLGGRTSHKAPEIKYEYLDFDSKCSVDLEDMFMSFMVIKALYPKHISAYNWDQIVTTYNGEKIKAKDLLSNDFKALFDILPILEKYYGKNKVRLIFAFD